MAHIYKIGDKYCESFSITEKEVNNFAEFSSDYNPIHIDADYARKRGYNRQVSHGAIQIAYLSKIIGMNFPGPGSMWMSQTVNWLLPVFVGDNIKICLEIKSYSTATKTFTLSVRIVKGNDKVVMQGEAQVKSTKEISFNDTSDVIQPTTSYKKIIKTDNKVALVTGASRGIGASIAKKLSFDGYSIVVNYNKDVDAANEIVNEISSKGGEAISIQADITNDIQINNMLEKIYSKWGRCDVLVHGASPPIEMIDALDIKYENIEFYLNYYLKGAISLVNRVAPSMKDNGFGRIVFIGTSYLFGEPPLGTTAYVSAKEALWGYTKALATDVARHGITVNMASPSLTITDLSANVPHRVKEVQAFKNPTRRLTTTHDTANQVSYICSEMSSYTNGINIPITGGPV